MLDLLPYDQPRSRWKIVNDPEYLALKYRLRNAENIRATVATLSTLPFSAAYRQTMRDRRNADSAVRHANKAVEAYRKRHGLGAVPSFWKPRAQIRGYAKIARLFPARLTAFFHEFPANMRPAEVQS